jgi:hypothetical protein
MLSIAGGRRWPKQRANSESILPYRPLPAARFAALAFDSPGMPGIA